MQAALMAGRPGWIYGCRCCQSSRMAWLECQQLLMPFRQALSGTGAGRFLWEPMEQLMPQILSPVMRAPGLSSLGLQQKTHRRQGMTAPALTPEFMAVAGHQQSRLTPSARVRRPSVHPPEFRVRNSRVQWPVVGAQQNLAGRGHPKADSRCGQQQQRSGPGSRGQTVAGTLRILKRWP